MGNNKFIGLESGKSKKQQKPETERNFIDLSKAHYNQYNLAPD